jgi:hypothetical protein
VSVSVSVLATLLRDKKKKKKKKNCHDSLLLQSVAFCHTPLSPYLSISTIFQQSLFVSFSSLYLSSALSRKRKKEKARRPDALFA